jgi:hypothetical protein
MRRIQSIVRCATRPSSSPYRKPYAARTVGGSSPLHCGISITSAAEFRSGLGQGRRSDRQRYVPFFQLRTLTPESNPLVRPSNPAQS